MSEKNPLETNNMLSNIILHNRLNVYSDVADYTYLCDLTTPILRFVPFKNSTHSQQSHKIISTDSMFQQANLT